METRRSFSLWYQGSIKPALCDRFIMQSSQLGPRAAFFRGLIIPEKSSVWKEEPRDTSLRRCSGPVPPRHKPKRRNNCFSLPNKWQPGYKSRAVTLPTEPPALPRARSPPCREAPAAATLRLSPWDQMCSASLHHASARGLARARFSLKAEFRSLSC